MIDLPPHLVIRAANLRRGAVVWMDGYPAVVAWATRLGGSTPVRVRFRDGEVAHYDPAATVELVGLVVDPDDPADVDCGQSIAAGFGDVPATS